MNRVLKRPMFRMGGSTEGITSGLDRKPLANGTDPYDEAIKTTDRFDKDISRFVSTQPTFGPGALPGFLTSFGLNLLATPPQGNIFQTAATAAKEPFQTFQASQLARNQDKSDLRKDIFTSALASEYDLEKERIEQAGEGTIDDRKTPEVERSIIKQAQENIFAAEDILQKEGVTDQEKLDAQRTIQINQNLGSLGALNQAQAQANLDAQREATRQATFLPQEQLDRFAGQVTGIMGGYPGQTQTTNIPNPTPLQTALGVGTTLAGIYTGFKPPVQRFKT
jgi:hypothetical protein